MIPANWFCVHPQTLLREVESHNDLNPPNCGTCECPIAGKMFHCGTCNSNLHPFCKSCPPILSSAIHPASNHSLTFVNRDFPSLLGGVSLRKQCMVCGEDIRGVSYACFHYNFYVHPQCSQLPRRIPHGPETNHTLELQVEDQSRNANCHFCRSQCGRWAYRCNVCSVNVHYWCLLKRPGDEPGESSTTTTNTRGRGASSSTPQRRFNTYGSQHNHQGLGYATPYYNMYNLNSNIGGFGNHGFPWGAGNYNHIPNHNNNIYVGGGGSGGIGGSGANAVAGSFAVNMICDLFQQGFFFG